MKLGWKSLGIVVGLVALVGCSSQTQNSQTGLVVSGVVQGNAALLTINGQPLDLSGASITVDGQAASASAVQPGVEISGSGRENGGRFRMSQVEVRYRAKGTVDQVDTANGLLDVVGLRAKITADTLIFRENADKTRTAITLADIKAGDYVKVSGLPQDDDTVIATRIELKTEDNPNKVELRVRVRGLDSTTKTFSYGLKTYTVNFSSAEVRGTLAEGGFVQVKGTKTDSQVSATQVRATESKPDAPNGTRIELRGTVSNLNTTAKTFTIENLSVDYSSAEVRGTLADQAVVEVRGTLEGTTVKASKVEVRGSGDNHTGAELEGTISSFNSTARTLVVNGITVTVDANTKYQEDAAQATHSGGGDKGLDLSADAFWGTNRDGRSAEVRGVAVDANTLLASRIELK